MSRQPPVEHLVDGVRVLHHPIAYGGDDDFTSAVLTFGVGAADEALPMLGVAHLVEHLSIWPARNTALDIDGTVELQSTTFTAHGRPGEVARFLTQICDALSRLPVEQIRHEAGVLEAEDARGVHPLMAMLFNLRFGNRGPGLLALAEPDPARFTGPAVQAFVDHWFVPANAFVQVIGRLPETLSFPLPQGPSPARTALDPTPVQGPAGAFEDPFEAVGLIIDLPLDPERPLAALCLDVLERRLLEETRFTGGYSYSVQSETYRWSATVSSTAFALDARPGVWREVAQRVIKTVLALAGNGPTDVELSLAIEADQQRRLTPLATPEQEWTNALHALHGWPEQSESSQSTALTAAEVTAVFAAALPSVIVCGPPVAGEAKPERWPDATTRTEVAGLPAGRRFRPGPLAQVFSAEARQASVVTTDDGIGQQLEGASCFVSWIEVIGVLDDVDEHVLLVHGPDGTVIDIGHHYRRGAELLQIVRDHVDPSLFYRPWHNDPDPAEFEH